MTQPVAPLIVRKSFDAPIEKVFAAWTDPVKLRQWWGPANVECIIAEIDLKIGGSYRIGNKFVDGSVVWISGEFLAIEPPRELKFSWNIEPAQSNTEQVTVRFNSVGTATEVVIFHEQISDVAVKKSHHQGWLGCLEGLADYLG